jgi:hypothetical protein
MNFYGIQLTNRKVTTNLDGGSGKKELVCAYNRNSRNASRFSVWPAMLLLCSSYPLIVF